MVLDLVLSLILTVPTIPALFGAGPRGLGEAEGMPRTQPTETTLTCPFWAGPSHLPQAQSTKA